MEITMDQVGVPFQFHLVLLRNGLFAIELPVKSMDRFLELANTSTVFLQYMTILLK